MATTDEIYAAIRNADKAGDSASVQKLGAYLQTMGDQAPADTGSDALWGLSQHALNAAGGIARGAGAIASTLVRPFESGAENDQRRARIDENMQAIGAQPDSWMYKGFKLGSEVAGTAGAGNLLAAGVRAAPLAGPTVNALARALETGGFSTGGGVGPAADAAIRAGAGAATGGATAGLVDPAQAKTGAIIGGVAPFVVQGAGAAGEWASERLKAAANKLMESALKPTIRMHQTGDAATAVQTLLDNGLNATKGGVNKLRAMIGDLNDQISAKIADSPATVSKNKVLDAAWNARQKFTNQVDPAADVNAIDGMMERFYLNPKVPAEIPVQQAQELKQGTYKVLSKKYGQLGSADTEGQKAMARGLKEGIADAVPEIAGLNAQESQLITTLKVAERRALMDMNKNPMGLAALAHSPASWAMFMADKSALFKSLAARMVNNAAPAAGNATRMLGNAAQNPLLRSGALVTEANP